MRCQRLCVGGGNQFKKRDRGSLLGRIEERMNDWQKQLEREEEGDGKKERKTRPKKKMEKERRKLAGGKTK